MATLAINIKSDGSLQSTAGTVPETLSVTHDGVGSYSVNGVIGVASDGWRTSIPTDDNGDRMIKVAFADIQDGVAVSVTNKDDQPTDIPEGRVLTLRLDVPDPEPDTPEDA